MVSIRFATVWEVATTPRSHAHGLLQMAARFPRAEKNLLKLFMSNKYVSIQAVNNRTGNVTVAASTMERAMRERLGVTWDSAAAKAAAELFAQRAREQGQQQLTWERGTVRFAGKVRTVIQTLRENGIEFVQHAQRRPPSGP